MWKRPAEERGRARGRERLFKEEELSGGGEGLFEEKVRRGLGEGGRRLLKFEAWEKRRVWFDSDQL